MTRNSRGRSVAVVAATIALVAGVAYSGTASQTLDLDSARATRIDDGDSWETVLTKLADAKAVTELDDAVIRIEVNSTDGDAGFQIFLDGEGWRMARVYEPSGRQILVVNTGGGVRHIGGGTELFMETEEPEYEDLSEYEDLIQLLSEGEYHFVTHTTGGDFAIGSAELTHDVPAGPEIVAPLVDAGEECAHDVLPDVAVIEWEPVTTQLTGEPEIDIVLYQVIVVDEETDREFLAEVSAGVTMVTIPPEFLEPGVEYGFEILAIEESGNQTITESCFETAE